MEHNLYQEKHQGRDRDNVPPWPPPQCKRAPTHVWQLGKVHFFETLIFKPHPVRKSAITFFFCSAVLLPSSLLNWMQQFPVSFSRSFSHPSDMTMFDRYSIASVLNVILTNAPDKVCRPAENLDFLPCHGK